MGKYRQDRDLEDYRLQPPEEHAPPQCDDCGGNFGEDELNFVRRTHAVTKKLLVEKFLCDDCLDNFVAAEHQDLVENKENEE